MANLYKTKSTYTASNNATVYSFPFDYLNRKFIKVKVDNVELEYLKDYRIENRTIVFTNAPTNGAEIVIYRATDTKKEVQWEDSSIFRANTLNLFQEQLLHITEETLDNISDYSIKIDPISNQWDATQLRLTNVANPIDSQDVVTKDYMDNGKNSFKKELQDLLDKARSTTQADHQEILKQLNAILSNVKQYETKALADADRAYQEAERAKSYADQVNVSQTRITQIQTQVNSTATQVTLDKQEVATNKASIESQKKAIDKTISDAHDATNEAKSTALEGLNNIKTIKAEAEAIQQENTEIKAEVAQLKNEATTQAKLAKDYADKISNITNEAFFAKAEDLSKTQTELSTVKQQVAENTTGITELQDELNSFNSEVSSFKKTTADNLSTLNADLTNLSTTATVKHKAITQEISKINTEVSLVKTQVATEVQSGLNEVKTLVNTKADSSNTYTKAEVDSKVNAKADSSNTYTKAEVDSKVNSNVINAPNIGNFPSPYTGHPNTMRFIVAQRNNGWPLDSGIIETTLHNDSKWVGSLLIANNGKDGVWTGGYYDGVQQPYRRLADMTEVVTNVRLGAQVEVSDTSYFMKSQPQGIVMTNWSSNNQRYRYKPIQIYKNGNWYTIEG